MPSVYVKAALRLTLESPFLSHGPSAVAWGVDIAQSRNANNTVILPGDLIRGNLRHAFVELGKPVDALFGRRDAPHDNPSRGCLHVSDLVAETPEQSTSQTRIRVDDDTGSVAHGALFTIELSHPIGEEVAFVGTLEWQQAEDETILDDLKQALGRIVSVGAFKSSGFGYIVDRSLVETHRRDLATPATVQSTSEDRYRLTLTFDRPLLVDGERLADNAYRSRTIIPGGALKGALAARLGPGAYDDALSAMVFNHAHVIEDDGPLPLSLVTNGTGKCVGDLLYKLQRGDNRTAVFKDGPPLFSIDWKDTHHEAVINHLKRRQGPRFIFETRTRTAIDSAQGISKESQLFTYSSLIPDPHRWQTVIDRGTADPTAFETLIALLGREGLRDIGKTGAAATITVEPAPPPPAKPTPDDLWAVTLATPALMNGDPALLRQSPDLWADYQAYWDHAMPGTTLLSFFARQRLAGGWQALKRRSQPYYPFLLTEPGSVFLLQGGDIAPFRRSNLPLPRWLDGATWRTCPFMPENGYGAICLNVVDHRALAERVQYA